MKKIIFSLLVVFIATTGFTNAPNLDLKDNWVYDLKPTVKPYEVKFYGPIKILSLQYNNPCTNGSITIEIKADYNDIVDRKYAILLAFTKNGATLWVQNIFTMPALYNHAYVVMLGTDYNCTSTITWQSVGWYNPQN